MSMIAKDTVDYKPTKASELAAYRERLKWMKFDVSDKCDYYLDPPEHTTDVKDAEVYGFELLQCIDTRHLATSKRVGKHLIANFNSSSSDVTALAMMDEEKHLQFIIMDGKTIVASSMRFDKKEDIPLVDIFPNGYLTLRLSKGLTCIYRHREIDKLLVISLSSDPVKPDATFAPTSHTNIPEDERPVNFWTYSFDPFNYNEYENRKDLTFAGLNYWVGYTGKYSENETHYPIIDGELAHVLHNEMRKELIKRNDRPAILHRVTGDDIPF